MPSAHPTAGPAGWSQQSADLSGAPVASMFCTTSTFCVAGDAAGNVLTSTDPAQGAASWSTKAVDKGGVMLGISCPVKGSCVAVDPTGYVLELGPNCVVPKVKGKTASRAERAIEAHACSVGNVTKKTSRPVRKGRVISEKPKAGKHLSHGANVNLIVSKGL